MNIVHVAYTPVAGSPWRIVSALNEYTQHSARLIVFDPDAYGSRHFPGDLSWKSNQEECIEQLRKADIIHLHQQVSLSLFGKHVVDLCRKKLKIRQYHSEPFFFSPDKSYTDTKIVYGDMPTLVIAQYHERYYPEARIVPNLLPLNTPLFEESPLPDDEAPLILCTPSLSNSAFSARWATKGMPEIQLMLEAFCKKNHAIYKILTELPFQQAMENKKKATIFIDDLVTGSYHFSGLESLVIGRPTLTYLDSRTEMILKEITGADDLPFLNVHLADTPTRLAELIFDRNRLLQLATKSAQWMRTYYNAKDLVCHYATAYEDLARAPEHFSSLRNKLETTSFRIIASADACWRKNLKRIPSTIQDDQNIIKKFNSQCSVPAFFSARLPEEVLSEIISLACQYSSILEVGFVESLAPFVRKKSHSVSGYYFFSPSICMEEGQSILTLPFSNQAFDVVIVSHTLEFLEENDLVFMLSELHRVARKALFFVIPPVSENSLPGYRKIRQNRVWWETKCFESGMRKHSNYYEILSLEQLNNDVNWILLPMEPIPEAVNHEYSLAKLQKEILLHMDMLRSSGRRADAHCVRYQKAAALIREGDVVLDLACGYGYGSKILFENSLAKSVLGIDNSAGSIEYALRNYGSEELKFQQGDAQDLVNLPDNSIDFVTGFETIEHLPDPDKYLDEIKRVLTPGGRVILSAPNMWVNEDGKDPNPNHLHVYSWEKLKNQLKSHGFLLEKSFNQVAGGALKCPSGIPAWTEIGIEKEEPEESEWVIVTAMKDPLLGRGVPYQEYRWKLPEDDAFHVVAFDRDYLNPYLAKAMVTIGLRISDPKTLQHIQKTVFETYPEDSVDYGAALCGLIYSEMNLKNHLISPEKLFDAVNVLAEKVHDNPHFLRWQVSCLYAAGVLAQQQADCEKAIHFFDECLKHDVTCYSPLLGTKIMDAAFQLANWFYQNGDSDKACTVLRDSLARGEKITKADWLNVRGDKNFPLPFGYAEMSQLLDKMSRAANLLHLLQRTHVPFGKLSAEAHKGYFENLLYCRDHVIQQFLNAMRQMDEVRETECKYYKTFLRGVWDELSSPLAQGMNVVQSLENSRSFRFIKMLRLIVHPENMGTRSRIISLLKIFKRKILKRPVAADYSLLAPVQENLRKMQSIIVRQESRCNQEKKFREDSLSSVPCETKEQKCMKLIWKCRDDILSNTFDVVLQADNFLVGGLENVVIDIAKIFQNHHIPVIIMVMDRIGKAAEVADRLGIPVWYQPYKESEYKSLLKRWRVKVVFSHYSIYGNDICSRLNIPYVQVFHNTYIFNEWFYNFFIKATGNVNGIIAVSDFVAEYSKKFFHLRNCNTVVIPNGTEIERFKRLKRHEVRLRIRSQYHIEERDKVFLVVGSFYQQKNYFTLLEAFALAVKEEPSAKLLIIGAIGEEELFNCFMEKVKAYHLEEKIIYVGHVLSPEEFYCAGDIFLQASLWEGCSLALQEALLMRLPIITSNVGIAAAIHNIPGIKVIPLAFGVMDVEGFNFERLYYDYPEVDRAFAEAMIDFIRHPVVLELPEEIDSLLAREHAYLPYIDIFHYLTEKKTLSGVKLSNMTWNKLLQ